MKVHFEQLAIYYAFLQLMHEGKNVQLVFAFNIAASMLQKFIFRKQKHTNLEFI